jgi:O-acetyl-ADP-ribose deacetylase (regulator of RNase III)
MTDTITVGHTKLVLKKGDITLEATDAIVNAANSSLMGGGGVDGAIHRAGGPGIVDECRKIRTEQGELPTGEAVITRGGNLKARYVIHTVGPVWHGGTHNEDNLLSNAYRNSLALAAEHKITSVAFPAISTGIYGFPPERASRIAFTTVCDFVRKHHEVTEVRFIVFSVNDYQLYRTLLGLEREPNRSISKRTATLQ